MFAHGGIQVSQKSLCIEFVQRRAVLVINGLSGASTIGHGRARVPSTFRSLYIFVLRLRFGRRSIKVLLTYKLAYGAEIRLIVRQETSPVRGNCLANR